MRKTISTATAVLPGTASGPVLFSDVGLSFMGGVDASSGRVIDTHHPLCGQSVAGKVLALPSGRGSCAGSLVIFELLLNGHAPKAMVFQHKETILTLGVLVAQALFATGIPIFSLPGDDFSALANAKHAQLDGESLFLSDKAIPEEVSRLTLGPLELAGIQLTPADYDMLAGRDGEAARIALELILRIARLEEAEALTDVERAHIDGCFYQGPGGLAFVQRLLNLGARVRIPATMNALCVDRRSWRGQGVAEDLGLASDALAEAYEAMGVAPVYTCAPYLLPDPPRFGQQIAWGESNAVVFANSVLGARTLKYPDYLDILVAITGRAPLAGCHRVEARRATLEIALSSPKQPDDAYFATLGYLVGKLSPQDIPLITGLEGLAVTRDDLKTFGAAFATTSSAAMFHLAGHTPEAGNSHPTRRIFVTDHDLRATWDELNSATTDRVDLISLGNPHASATEIAAVANLCAGRQKSADVSLIITCGREVMVEAAKDVDQVKAFGGVFLNDTCWCLITEPVVAPSVRQIATNSGKYAHYGPAAVRRAFHLASLTRCIDAACTGKIDRSAPSWLSSVG